MDIAEILVFVVIASIIRLLFSTRWRQLVIFIISVAAVYWLQPITPLRNFDFWFPSLTLILVLLVWIIVHEPADINKKQNLISIGLYFVIILLVGLTRWVSFDGILTPTRPPPLLQICAVITISGLIFFSLRLLKSGKRFFALSALGMILLIFVCLKTPSIALRISETIRRVMSQSVTTASGLDFRWLGFSYVAFRLIHVLRDFQKGRFSPAPFIQFAGYVLFFPAFVAGPIDRAERFIRDLEASADNLWPDYIAGGKRVVFGLFKKFVIADSLSLFALNPINASQVNSSAWGWVLLIAYAFQILMDFSGYTDIAIGLARFMGIKLPENFNRPYLQQNLTKFWNNWHMTLTNWFRAYFFNPVTRSLRRQKTVSQTVILLIAQFSTMVLIGLWHGITINFLIWGIWHGAGLFVQNRWSAWVRPGLAALQPGHFAQKGLTVMNLSLTFLYVSLGWVWFALPEFDLACEFILKLFFIS